MVFTVEILKDLEGTMSLTESDILEVFTLQGFAREGLPS